MEQVGVNLPNWTSLACWVLKSTCCPFDVYPDIFVRHITPESFIPMCQQICLIRLGVLADVAILPHKSPIQTVVVLSINFLMDAHSFPTILLVIQLQRCTLCSHNCFLVDTSGKLTALSLLVPIEKRPHPPA